MSIVPTGCGFRIQSVVLEICGQSSLKTVDITSDSHYRALIEDLPEVIYTMDKHRVIIYISPEIEWLLSDTALELIGRDLCVTGPS